MGKKILSWFIGLSCVIALLVYFNNISNYSFYDRLKSTCSSLSDYNWLEHTKEVLDEFSIITSKYSNMKYFMESIQITLELVFNFIKVPIVLSLDIISSITTIIKFIYSILGLI